MVEELSEGAVRMGPGALYGTINRLLEAGLVEETTERRAATDDAPTELRHYCELTGAGRAVALSALIVAIVVGHPAVLAGGVAASLALGGLALLAAHRDRPLTAPRLWSSRGWLLLTSGLVLLAGLVVVTNATVELPSGGWFVAMTVGLAALLLMAGGLILGIVHLASRDRRWRVSP